MTYEQKIEHAIKLLQSIPQDGPIELCYSCGKDSDVILELAKMAGIPFVPIYKQTSIDPPGTTMHAKEKVRQYLPILEWTDDDVERFIKERGIKCAPVYYDDSGNFHVERRLGCIGCPLKADNGLSDYKKYPKFLKAQVKAYQRFLDKHTTSKWYERI